MADLPILFSAPMVQAILREIEQPGTGKTQTRRTNGVPTIEQQPNGLWHVHTRHGGALNVNEADIGSTAAEMLRIQPGDRLWVREAWTHTGHGVWTVSNARMSGRGGVHYRADGDIAGAQYFPSIHMPKEFSRITLYVTEVRVQRLQDISEEDARAEGIIATRPGWFAVIDKRRGLTEGGTNARLAFAHLWESINGVGSYLGNPWVAAYTFKPVLANIDSLPASGELA